MTEIGAGVGPPEAHKTTHQDGGSDEIDITGLAGAVGLDDSPVNGEITKGITSNWAYDHKADAVAHHPAVDPGEGHILLLGANYNAAAAGTWTAEQSTLQITDQRTYNTTHALNDEINFKAFLAAGTYSLLLWGQKTTIGGIAQVLIDGVAVATFDEYASPDVQNFRFEQTGIIIASSGIKTISVKLTDKNASSSDYYFFISLICLYRTA